MEIADVELAKMAYLVNALAIVLFTSMILRGLWRPLRFVLIACAISVFFTPYFLAQKMPDGRFRSRYGMSLKPLQSSNMPFHRWEPNIRKPVYVSRWQECSRLCSHQNLPIRSCKHYT